MAFVETLKSLVDTLGATVLLPIFIFLFALVLGAKPGKAFRSAVIIGVAFIGINLVIGLMWGSLSGVSQALVTNSGIERDIIDVGWPAAAAVAFATDVGLWIIPVALVVNFVLLFLGVTKTLNVDVWNFWHYAFVGSLVAAVTGNLAMGIATGAVAAAFMLFLGDWTARGIQEFYDLPGISIPHGFTAPMVPLALPFNWLYGKIPGLKDIDADTDGIERALGPTFGDPMIMGLLIGVILGLIAYFGEFAGNFVPTFGKIIVLGVELAAVMVILPRMVRILMEGLIPISEAARDFMAKRASGREIYIGLDSAVLVGHPSAISTGLLLVPIAILLSMILPGNRMLLFADLAVLPFLASQIAPMAKGNIVRMVSVGTVLLIFGFYIANALAPVITKVAGEAGFAIPENAAEISSIADGFAWTPLAFMWIGDNMGWVGIGLAAVVTGLLFYFFKKNESAWEVVAGASPRE
ncbi:MAG: PTS sugar transporter subunit IIC [Bacteroidetes bacterium]|jgi:galactitol PTS system EIIC component|nr:PTS sugar transporter subunit IIC [Bacteroidota bacterium]